jgi:hypothetical protein
MSNTIDLNLGDNNPMESLSLYWKAELKNGEVINQFDNNLDKNYARVKENLINLRWFILYDKNNFNKKFMVDLENGFIYTNNIIQDFAEVQTKIEKKNIRLIYCRRKRIKIGNNKPELTIRYILGFQYNDTFGYNRKIVLQIDESGNWILGD